MVMGTPCSGPQSSPLASAPSAFATFVQETNHGHVCVAFENGRIEERADRSFRNPGFAQDERYPVVCVNWDDAKAFVVWLSKKTGKPYRLLSGAEREYVGIVLATTTGRFADMVTSAIRPQRRASRAPRSGQLPTAMTDTPALHLWQRVGLDRRLLEHQLPWRALRRLGV